MKKGLKLAMFGAVLALFAGISFKSASVSRIARAEDTSSSLVDTSSEEPTSSMEVESSGEPVETHEATVIIEKAAHGTITASLEYGNIGDVCVITAKHDLLYKVSFVKLNGVELVEDENISGKYSFELVAGENRITSSFVVDSELCGELTGIVDQVENKDWSNLFSLENVVVFVKWVIDGGLFFAILRYYVKDKRLESKLEAETKRTLSAVVPETTKVVVVETIQNVLAPIFADLKSEIWKHKEFLVCLLNVWH